MGIPCVINTRNGTRVLNSGDRIRVDGSSGAVTILAV
jgi:phosphoenolpyruvate synthase/pyruvate phosphate dikinase